MAAAAFCLNVAYAVGRLYSDPYKRGLGICLAIMYNFYTSQCKNYTLFGSGKRLKNIL
jgi:hypothetical protein